MNYKLLEIKHIASKDHPECGLAFFETERDIPFPVKRIYWIYGEAEGITRGYHAHKQNVQLLFCPCGSIDVLMTDGTNQEAVTLDDPAKALLLPPELWHEMKWNKDGSVLCVAASDYYDETDYIRNYDQFMKFVEENKAKEKKEKKKGK